MSRDLPPTSGSRYKRVVYPRAKGVAPPASTPNWGAAAKLSALCLTSLVLLSFLVAWSFRGKSADTTPSASSAAVMPEPAAGASAPSSPAAPLSPPAEAKAEPVLKKAEALPPPETNPLPTGEVGHAVGKAAPGAMAVETPLIVRETPPLDPPMKASPIVEKAPVVDAALLEKPPVVPPGAHAEEKRPDPSVVDCSKLGTRIVFLRDPPEAFKKAREERKLVFFIHLSGNFEDDAFT